MNKIKRIINNLFPNKKINRFIIFIFLLGIVTSSFFICFININDKNKVITSITKFIYNCKYEKIDYLYNLKNIIIINLFYIILIFINSYTIIGNLLNIFIYYIKCFIFGFILSSFILSYKIKGIILIILYLFSGSLLNIISISFISILNMMFLNKIINKYKNKELNINKFMKNYFILFIFIIILSVIGSIMENYLFTWIIKLIGKIF